jgi:hypothetical protein
MTGSCLPVSVNRRWSRGSPGSGLLAYGLIEPTEVVLTGNLKR